MNNLNQIIQERKIIAYGFKAFQDLSEVSNQGGEEVVVSTLSPAVMAEKGIYSYYAPVLPRGVVYQTVEEIMAADLPVNLVRTQWANPIESTDNVIIASRHPGTIQCLQSLYPHNVVLASAAPDDIKDKNVVGTLPPALIQYADRYRAVTIKGFDYVKDGDLNGEELAARMQLSDSISVTIA